MRRRVRDGRGAKRRWSPHFSYLNEEKVKRRWWSNSIYRLRYWNASTVPVATAIAPTVATAPTVYGIETRKSSQSRLEIPRVATAPTVYGIETCISNLIPSITSYKLQQHLPFTVLKHLFIFTSWRENTSCNSTYRLRYWNNEKLQNIYLSYVQSCNSTYRLRYWNATALAFLVTSFHAQVATVLTVYGIETLGSYSLNNDKIRCVATVLTVYGIETLQLLNFHWRNNFPVATVLTVYGIETH